ncbi:hypothetical protein PoB_000754700 [Plakobranchus ocellatus]|uniref:HTH psq-type domain-containing protein n=1 Tax=Plakobranchus ocellatus TaxID=259542 RepID=A0AAV3YF14_9GAST|nr:hypothetical protein PoB_000754700 [Plakobranchus ocellatus]
MFLAEQKAETIKEVERKRRNKAEICKDYNISSGTLYTVLRDEAIMTAVSKGQFQPDRHLQTTGHEKLDPCKAEDVKKLMKFFRVPERAEGFYDDVLMAAEAKNEDTDERDDMCSYDENESFM